MIIRCNKKNIDEVEFVTRLKFIFKFVIIMIIFMLCLNIMTMEIALCEEIKESEIGINSVEELKEAINEFEKQMEDIKKWVYSKLGKVFNIFEIWLAYQIDLHKDHDLFVLRMWWTWIKILILIFW